MRPQAWLLIALAGSVMLAGCVERAGEGPDGGDDAPYYVAGSKFGLKVEDVQLHKEITPGSEKTWRFQARNTAPEGENPIHYRFGCGDPWVVTVKGPDGSRVETHEPMATCQGFENKVLFGGETLELSWPWDGRVWSEATGYLDARAGTYTIEALFEGNHDGNEEHKTDVPGITRVEVI